MTASPQANLVYWYSHDDMPRDGGGLRAIAWHEALTELGFKTTIHPLRRVGSGVENLGVLRRVKKKLIPMPIEQQLGTLPPAHLNVITVPSVFGAAARTLPIESLVFDWMDLWSVNALTMGNSSLLSRPGGMLQSVYWSLRQRSLAKRPLVNTFAGFRDRSAVGLPDSGYWIPTPITAVRRDSFTFPKRPARIGFIGNFSYHPNAMSLRKFFNQYGEKIQSSGLEVVIAGFGSEVVRGWNVPATVVGPVESLSDFYHSIDAAIVPIDHGGGIKAKAIEAMAHGVPVFGTRHVRSGFDPRWASYITPLEKLFIGDDEVPPVPPISEFESQFSQHAFTNTVKYVLADSGKLKKQ